jgi:hypothetical protein
MTTMREAMTKHDAATVDAMTDEEKSQLLSEARNYRHFVAQLEKYNQAHELLEGSDLEHILKYPYLMGADEAFSTFAYHVGMDNYLSAVADFEVDVKKHVEALRP